MPVVMPVHEMRRHLAEREEQIERLANELARLRRQLKRELSPDERRDITTRIAAYDSQLAAAHESAALWRTHITTHPES